MKTPKILLAAVFAVLGLSHLASAQVAIYLSGAPATRAIWNTAILDTLAANTPGGASSITKYWSGGSTSSGYSTANQIVLTGGQISGTAVTIYGSWTGSTGGNQSIAISPPQSNSALEIQYLNLSNLTTPGGGYTLDSSNKQYPQVNLSDTQQNTIPFHGTVKSTSPTTVYSTLSEATTPSPAVTGFEWVVNKGTPSNWTNFTPDQAYQLFIQGPSPLSFFTGNSADTSTTIYPVGRDIASGARYAMLAETAIGTSLDNQLVQYEPTVTSGTITNAAVLSGSGTINLISFPQGNGGYSSFSSVLTVLEATSSASVGYVVSYVTDSDAATAVTNGARALTWNGVAYSPAAIEQGSYTFWTFLHVYYNNITGYAQTNFPLAKTFGDLLAADLYTDTNTGAILYTSLQVSRQYDGGYISPNN